MFWMGPRDMGSHSRLPGIITFLFGFPNSKQLAIVNPYALRARWAESKPDNRGASAPATSLKIWRSAPATWDDPSVQVNEQIGIDIPC